jgi:hypothetical protein
MGAGFLKNLATIFKVSKKKTESPEGNFIEKDGVMISIFDTSVSVQDIFSFFQGRMPWLEIIVSENIPPEFTNAKAKEELYQHFIEHLETQHYEWTEAFKKESSPVN